MSKNHIVCQRCGNIKKTRWYKVQKYCSYKCARASQVVEKKLVEELFYRHVSKTDTCWLWTGSINGNGYGLFGSSKKFGPMAHRVSYQLSGKIIPDGMVLDHLCRVRLCVNPDHLEVVTHRENCMRGEALNIKRYLSGKCKNGHDMTGDNWG